MPASFRPTQLQIALLILVIAAATLGGAWIFQAFGYAPCELCLKQRIPYYIGIPLAAITVLAAFRRQETLLLPDFIGLVLLFGFSTLFGAYHSGVEWGFWQGPSDCTGSLSQAGSVDDFLKQLQTVKVVRCDAVAIRILGLSLAAWNAVISAVLTALAIMGIRTRGDR
jgi:disulfide bond formation protein DsbB